MPVAEHLTRRESYTSEPLRDCDIVMKGGITSGVVYPLAVCELATQYRFRSIGGTSAGAIAAAGAAAAELGRDSGGFVDLAGLPAWLGSKGNLRKLFRPNPGTRKPFWILMAALKQRRGPFVGVRKPLAVLTTTVVLSLFSRWFLLLALGAAPGAVAMWAALDRTPAPSWSAGMILLFGVVLTAMGVQGALSAKQDSPDPLATGQVVEAPRVRAALDSGVPVVVGLGLVGVGVYLVARMVGDAADVAGLVVVAAAEVTLIVGVILTTVVAFLLNLARSLTGNSFGLVGGSRPDGDRGEPLSDWLTTSLNRYAGRTAQSPLLTFSDLRKRSDGGPAVNLEMMTTCLTEGRPYRLPDELGDGTFYFEPAEMRKLFPARVVHYLLQHPRPSVSPWPALTIDGRRLHLLPEPDQLPVVFATRMSLSFPVLLSAVPLYRVDWSREHNQRAKAAWAGRQPSDPEPDIVPIPEVCWFSDGGIISNFPVHFFDKPLPRWPTFGISLRGFHPDHRKDPHDESRNIYLPSTNGGGLLTWWTRFGTGGPLTRVSGFLHAIADTMQNWVDNDQVRVPGYRDRVAFVHHDGQEGGMNLDMPAAAIESMSQRGWQVGRTFREYFTTEDDRSADEIPPGESRRTVSWRNHRWVRFRSTLAIFEEMLTGLSDAYTATSDTGTYRSMLHGNVGDAPSYPLNLKERTLAIEVLEGNDGPPGIIGRATHWKERSTGEDPVRLAATSPKPVPGYRIAPRGGTDQVD